MNECNGDSRDSDMKAPRDEDIASLRNILLPFVVVLMMSVIIITALTIIAARSQGEAEVQSSVHLTRSVVSDIERRLADQLLDYSYWDEAVQHLVTKPNLNWADKNVGIYMHDRFQISSSFVVDAAGRRIYAMVNGKRRDTNPLTHFSGGLDRMLEMARKQPKNKPPTPITGIISDGTSAHIVAVSTLTKFTPKSAPETVIATGSTLIFTRAIDRQLLVDISKNYLLRDLRFVDTKTPQADAFVGIVSFDGTPIGFLEWTPESHARDLLTVVLPLISLAFVIFGVTAFVFYRRAQSVTRGLSSDNLALRIARENLRVAKEEAETANQTKTSFLANMSHELRTPLNSIIGFSELLKEQIFGRLGHENYTEYAANIHFAGRHLLDLINDILDVSKIEADELEIAEKELNMADLIRSCILIVREQADEARVILSTEISDSFPWIRGDDVRIKQIVLNLLSNSIKFTPPNGTVKTKIFTDDGAVILQISDTGIGIAEGDMPKVLAPFQQVRNNYNHSGTGTGLGVHLSQRIAELHGGTLSIESAVGKGTTVTVRFPPERTMPN